MSNQADNLVELLDQYGLSSDESQVYLYLLKHGFTTALTLSRELHFARTKVYRILEDLKKKTLVLQKLEERGLKFGATSPTELGRLVTEKEQTVELLHKSLPGVISTLEKLVPTIPTDSKVLYYEGIEGLKQVSYNIIHAKDLVRVFEVEHMADFIPNEFAESIRKELVDRKITTYDLTNKTQFPGFTDVSEMIKHYSQFRHIDPVKLKINFEVLIYNDVYATYTYKDEKIFCVEIYNEHLADMQKQIFDFVWSQAKPMKFTNKRGAAEI